MAAASLALAAVTMVMTSSLTHGQTITRCDYDEASCGCRTDKGLISLKHFGDQGLASAASPGGGVFYWNPCRDFTSGEVKAACVQHISFSLGYDCGVHENSQSSVKDGNALFQMQSADFRRESKLTCICGSAEQLQFINEAPTTVYNLKLISTHCCPGRAGGSGSSVDLSAGSVLVILFFCLVIVYLVGGVIVQTGLRKAKGRERIPNVEFWADVPGLIMEGFRFTFSCGRPTEYRQF